MFILVIFVIITMENTVSAADGGQLCLTSLFHRYKTKQGRGLGKSSWKVLKKNLMLLKSNRLHFGRKYSHWKHRVM